MENSCKRALSKIQEAQNILLVTHNKPDGDAVSSVCAIIEILEALNKNYFAYCYDPAPYQFNFLPHLEKIDYQKDNFNFENYDLIISLDCGSMARTNLAEEIKNKNDNQIIIEFDHHPKIDNYSDIEIRLSHLSSTAEVLYFFLKTNNIKINKNLANCILTGILTDTGNLLYNSTTDNTIKIASEMLSCGARFPQILENTWRNKSLNAMKIWGTAMSNLTINKKYNFGFSIITKEHLDQDQVTEEEIEGIAGFLSNLYGVKGLLLLREEPNGKIKGSLRTNHPTINVSTLAQALGGGGHIRASGFSFEGKITQNEDGWKII